MNLVQQKLGIIDASTAMAADSSGTLLSTAMCSGSTAEDMYKYSTQYWYGVKSAKLAGFGQRYYIYRKALNDMLPTDAASRCNNTWISVTALDKLKPNFLLHTGFRTRKDLIDIAVASAYLPFDNGKDFAVPAAAYAKVMEGYLLDPIPCPPTVKYCIKISVMPNDPKWWGLKAFPPGVSQFKGDIWPGLAGRPIKYHPMRHLLWFYVPPKAMEVNDYYYNLGVEDATYWAHTTGMAQAASKHTSGSSLLKSDAAATISTINNASASHSNHTIVSSAPHVSSHNMP